MSNTTESLRKVQEIREDKYTIALRKSASEIIVPERSSQKETAPARKARGRKSFLILGGIVVLTVIIAGILGLKSFASRTARESARSSFAMPTPVQLQTALKNAGFYKGEIDGKIGPQTITAIIAFQKAQQVDPNGIAGVELWEALKKYLKD